MRDDGALTITRIVEVGDEPGELRLAVQPNVFTDDIAHFTGRF